jgi:transposase
LPPTTRVRARAGRGMDAESKAISAPARQARRVWPVSAEAPRPTRSFQMLQHRNLIERFFNRLKYFRAVATRYEKIRKARRQLPYSRQVRRRPNLEEGS